MCKNVHRSTALLYLAVQWIVDGIRTHSDSYGVLEYFTVLKVNGFDESFLFINLQFCFFFYPKWFEPSRLFGFHFFPPHLPSFGLSPSGKHIEVLEGGREKEMTWHFMVVSSWKSLEESFCRYDSSCHVRSLWVAHRGNFSRPRQLPAAISDKPPNHLFLFIVLLFFRHRTESKATVWTLL